MPKGLLDDKPRTVVYVQSSGANIMWMMNPLFNKGLHYIEDMMKFMGIKKFEELLVDGTGETPEEKEKAIEKLNEKEIKVYQYILAHSLEFPFMTIRELADKVQVSTTVILNYVKKMGYKSFKEFKLAYRLQERKSRESKRIYDDKQVIGALIQLDNEYYQEKLHLAKVMIGNHNNLIFTGVGNSGLIGAYGARIFSSAGKYANVINDPFMRINASMEDTVIIALSISGKTPELLRIVESCKTFGACIISITANMKSPLALMSDISIPYFLKIDNIDQIDLTSQILAVAIIERLARND